MRVLMMLLLIVAGAAVCQDTIDNEAVIKMTKAGLSDSIIVTTVQSSAGKFSTGPNDLVYLKEQGVSDKVIAAILARGGPAMTVPSAGLASADPEIPAGIEIGVYYKKAGKWEEMLPEVVNWKTGGVVKSIASAGIMKGDVNGHVNGAHSRNSSVPPVEILIYAPEGAAITEYQLVHLHEQKDAREFRTITGGIMHVSGGATRDLLPFEGKKIAPRTYKAVLLNLGEGEYAFLPPGAFTSSTGAASLGKMYSFRIVEDGR
jgi:hypothetical protein